MPVHLLHFIASNLILNIFGQHMSSHLAQGQFLFSWTGHGGHILWWENLTSTLMSAKKKNCAGSHCYSPGFLHADKYCAQFFFNQICWWKKEGSWESNVNRMFQIRPFERFHSRVFEYIFQHVMEFGGWCWQRMCDCVGDIFGPTLLRYLEAQQYHLLFQLPPLFHLYLYSHDSQGKVLSLL